MALAFCNSSPLVIWPMCYWFCVYKLFICRLSECCCNAWLCHQLGIFNSHAFSAKSSIFFTLLLFSVTKWVYILIRHSSATERLLLNACISMIVHGCPLRKNADLFCYCCYKFKVHLAIKVSKTHILKDVRLIASEKFSV